MQSNKTFLITGGAGSIGSALVSHILEKYDPAAVRVFDNSDYLLAKLERKLNDPRVRYILGNIQDRHRLELALQGVNYVFHLAAIKDISVTEYNPLETINTNVIGTAYLIECCLNTEPYGPIKVMNLSSDKAVGFNTLYGATKYISEKLFEWGYQVGHPGIIFSNFRLGNVIESRGNVFEIWKEQSEKSLPLTITDDSMQRYFIHINKAVELITKAFESAKGGELFIPDMDEFSLIDIASELYDDHPRIIIGIRKGEKIREELISDHEKERAVKTDGLWIIYPNKPE